MEILRAWGLSIQFLQEKLVHTTFCLLNQPLTGVTHYIDTGVNFPCCTHENVYRKFKKIGVPKYLCILYFLHFLWIMNTINVHFYLFIYFNG